MEVSLNAPHYSRSSVQKNEQNEDTENPCLLSVAVHIVDISLPFVTKRAKRACLSCAGVYWYLERTLSQSGKY